MDDADRDTRKKPWELRWPAFIGDNASVGLKSTWNRPEIPEDQLCYERVWEVPPDDRRTRLSLYFCPSSSVARLRRKEPLEPLPREGASALPAELEGTLSVLSRAHYQPGKKAYQVVAEYKPGRLVVLDKYRKLGLAAELLLAVAEHSGNGRPGTAHSFSMGGFKAMRKAWLLGVSRAINGNFPVPQQVLTDFVVVPEVSDPAKLLYWRTYRPTPVWNPATGELAFPERC